jgi:hypothetical protein
MCQYVKQVACLKPRLEGDSLVTVKNELAVFNETQTEQKYMEFVSWNFVQG